MSVVTNVCHKHKPDREYFFYFDHNLCELLFFTLALSPHFILLAKLSHRRQQQKMLTEIRCLCVWVSTYEWKLLFVVCMLFVCVELINFFLSLVCWFNDVPKFHYIDDLPHEEFTHRSTTTQVLCCLLDVCIAHGIVNCSLYACKNIVFGF